MAATFTGMGRKTDDDPNLPEGGYVTIKFRTVRSEDEEIIFEEMEEDVQAWFDSDEAQGEYDWTSKRYPLTSSLESRIDVFYHFTDPTTAFNFKLRFG